MDAMRKTVTLTVRLCQGHGIAGWRQHAHSRQAKEIESAPKFVRERRAHSSVESAINGLEVHGLDVCLDHGIAGFKRYVAWAVLASNDHRIGAILWQQDLEQEQRHSRAGKPERAQRRTA